MMPDLLRDVDRILRTGVSGVLSNPPPIRRMLQILIGLGAGVGAGIGMFAVIREGAAGTMVESGAWMQPIASAIKIPALFVLTIATTIPSLYVFNTLLGPGHGLRELAGSICRSLVVMLAILASVVPIILFFSIVTSSYPFMKILVAGFAVFAGLLGTKVILSELGKRQLPTSPKSGPSTTTDDPETPANPPAVSRPSPGSLVMFTIWCLLFALVGSQMAWILRPFIGAPSTDFVWFRPAGGNLLMDLFETVRGMLGG